MVLTRRGNIPTQVNPTALKGQNLSAQGTALGINQRPTTPTALKGQHHSAQGNPTALKGQHHSAQGNALGINE